MSTPKDRSPIVSHRALARLGTLVLLALLLVATAGCKKRHKALELYREGYRVFRFEVDPGRAEGILQKALEVDPTLTQAHVELAVIHMYDDGPGSKTYSLSKAEQHLREAVRLAPDHIYAHYWLGKVAYAKGEFDEALREFDTTTKLLEWPFGSDLSGNWMELYLFKGLIQLDAGDFAGAEASLEKYNSFSPNRYYYLAGMAFAAEARGDRARAEALTEKLLGKFALAEPAAYLGLVEVFRGKPERAADIFKGRLKKLDDTSRPQNVELDEKTLYLRHSYRRLLAWAYMKAGRPEEAKGLEVGEKSDHPPSTFEVLRLAVEGADF